MVCRLDGAASEADLGRRAARALTEILNPDHISVWLLDGARPILAGKEGKSCTLFEGYKFEPIGIEGWLNAGAPPILAYDTAQSQILDTTQAAKDRVGSYVAVPIVH